MDVNREWRRRGDREYECGFYRVYKPIDKKTWEIYWDNSAGFGRFGVEILASDVQSATEAKAWIKNNWRKHSGVSR